ncbi:bridge-like lipid transfer protein family member 3B isoform X2 [Microcaecilia unicolor]|uniref:UHRF1-binding protein 1-like isoform X2 n=1 Tax=Microcaecilia unicolor TaxID=1415580 RepID=A0A6P7Z3L6_9AMPH|nr:UHRF1-binding protein 1-like isoform X2 [Microcaecilia unicolor]
MAGLIKKQILKHLSRFTKNLSPDKINLSTLKGEGQLTNLELDEQVLQNMLDLPTWLAINKVFCNKASIRIPWTKLKTHPISLSLDKVVMEMSTCEEPRARNGPSPLVTGSGQSEYGFAEKVVEGISLSVNSIIIRIGAKAFNASFELSQLRIYSVNASWQHGDLRFTRIQDPQRGEVLTFKEIGWQMIRIEADCIQSSDHEVISAPVRLITNQSKIRVTLKRRLKDCNVVASKLLLMLDDLLWVLTDSQLKAMVQYAKSLSEAIEKSAEQRKSIASEPTQSSVPAPSSQQVRTQQPAATQEQNQAIVKLFSDFDVKETSHHLFISHLDLHICDDIHSPEKGFNRRITGGAMQLSFSQLTVDYYPSHRAGDSCFHWMHYGDATKTRCGWATELFQEFKSSIEMLKQAVKDQSVRSPTKSPDHSCPQHLNTGKEQEPKGTSADPSLLLQQPEAKLMSSSVVVQLADFNIYQVSTADQCRSSPKALISCNKKTLYLPKEMSAVHIEFTEYYFPDAKDFPIPSPNLYMQLNALQLVLDERSILWLNQFLLDLTQSLHQFMAMYKLNDNSKSDEHIDIRVDGLMLKFMVPSQKKLDSHPDQPNAISIQTAEMIATNTRQSPNCRRSDLEAVFQDFKDCAFFSKTFTDFPRSTESFDVLHSVFQRHAYEQDTKIHDVYKGHIAPTLSAHALKMSAGMDIWAFYFSQFWMDFEGMKSGKGRPVSFVDSFPLSVWLCQPKRFVQSQRKSFSSSRTGANISKSESLDLVSRLQRKKLLKDYYSSESEHLTNDSRKTKTLENVSAPPVISSSSDADVHILVHAQKHVGIQINHHQYIFLLLLHESIKQVMDNLRKDVEAVTGKPAEETKVCLGAFLKSAEVALLLHPLPPANGCKSPEFEVKYPLPSDQPLETEGNKLVTNHMTCESNDNRSVATELNKDVLLDPVCGRSTTDTDSCKDNVNWPTPRSNSEEVCLEFNEINSSLYSLKLQNINPNREDLGQLQTGKEYAEEDLSNEEPSKENRTNKTIHKISDVRPQSTLSFQDMEIKETLSQQKLPSPLSSSGKSQERCQSNLPTFSVSYKNMKSSSQMSLDTISIDSNILEDQLSETDASDGHIILQEDAGIEEISSIQTSKVLADIAQWNESSAGSSPEVISAASESTQETSRDVMSVVVFKIFGINCGVDVKGEDAGVALQINQVTPKQLGNVSIRQYFSNRTTGSDENCSECIESVPKVKLRLESGPSASRHSRLAAENGFLQCHLQHFSSEFLTSSLLNIQRFLDDESIADVIPMKLSLSDTRIHLKDDSPRDNPAAPEPKPVTVHIEKLLVERFDDGSFCIRGSPLSSSGDNLGQRLTTDGLQRSGNAQKTQQKSHTERATQTQVKKCIVPSHAQKMGSSAQIPDTMNMQELLEENESLKQELATIKMALAESQLERESLIHRMKRIELQ